MFDSFGNRRCGFGRRAGRAGLVLSVVCLTGCLAGCVDIRVPSPDVRYIAFGDSTTAGPSTREYPDILRELLGAETKTFVNEGQSGENTEDGLARWRSLLDGDIYPNATVLLYWEGGNDVSDFIKEHDRFLLWSPDDPGYPFTAQLEDQLRATQANIESAVAAGRDAGLQVWVATYFAILETFQVCDALPLAVLLPGQAANANAYLAKLNERIRAAAVEQGAILVDVAGEDGIGSNADNYHDCNHLSEDGNGIAARLFFEAIDQP